MRCLRWAGSLLLLCVSVLPALALPQATGRTELELGVLSYKNARYEEAIEHFRKAVEAEPGNINARMYLATAYGQQYIPWADTPDNIRYADLSIEQYEKVLDIDSNNLKAAKGAAYMYLTMRKFESARKMYKQASQIDPNDPDPHYSIGVIDWTQTYQPRMALREKLKLKPEEALINYSKCPQIRDANKDLIEEGIEELKQAIDLKNDYDDAMAYMNLMYRERADIRCGDSKANEADLRAADDWVDLTIATKKKKEQNNVPKGESGVTVNFTVKPDAK